MRIIKDALKAAHQLPSEAAFGAELSFLWRKMFCESLPWLRCPWIFESGDQLGFVEAAELDRVAVGS